MANRRAEPKRRERELDRRRPPRLSACHAVAIGALSLIGLLVSTYLTYVHMRLRAEPGWESLCDVSDTVSCAAVVSSPYGMIAGIPLSALATWFYALVAVITWTGFRRRRGAVPRSPAAILFLAGSFAAVISLVLGVISFVQIGALCPLCVALYAVNAGLLVTGCLALRSTGESFFEALTAERQHWHRHGGRILLSSGGILLLLIVIVIISTRSSASVICEAAALAARDGSPITMIIYADFQCPHCRALDRALRPLRGNPGLRIVSRHYPLERICNPRMKKAGHAGACLQARAAICAGKQGRYESLSDRLFDEGPRDQAGLTALAKTLGLNPEQFTSCISSEETRRAVEADVTTAIADGVRGTPMILINGRRHAGAIEADDVACLVRATAEPREGVNP